MFFPGGAWRPIPKDKSSSPGLDLGQLVNIVSLLLLNLSLICPVDFKVLILGLDQLPVGLADELLALQVLSSYPLQLDSELLHLLGLLLCNFAEFIRGHNLIRGRLQLDLFFDFL